MLGNKRKQMIEKQKKCNDLVQLNRTILLMQRSILEMMSKNISIDQIYEQNSIYCNFMNHFQELQHYFGISISPVFLNGEQAEKKASNISAIQEQHVDMQLEVSKQYRLLRRK